MVSATFVLCVSRVINFLNKSFFILLNIEDQRVYENKTIYNFKY